MRVPSISRAFQARALVLALIIFGCFGTTRAIAYSSIAPSEAAHLANALASPRGEDLADIFAPNAEIWLVGATDRISPADFQAYVDRLKQSGAAFVPTSATLRTADGTGWFSTIHRLADKDSTGRSGDTSAWLWVEAVPANGKITRLWFHFTASDVQQQRGGLDAYIQQAAARGTPVPPGWENGDTAVVDAVRGAEGRRGASQTDKGDALAVASWIPLTVLGSVRLARSHPTQGRRQPSGVFQMHLLQFDVERRARLRLHTRPHTRS